MTAVEREGSGGFASEMDLRDHFAGLAMQAVIGLRDIPVDQAHREKIADVSYQLADAMLERRKR